MVSTFDLKDIFKDDFCESISKKYNFKKNDSAEIHKDLEETFKDFIILILSENNSYTIEERNKLYNEAIFNLQQTSKLLQGMPHPASSMSYKLLKMAEIELKDLQIEFEKNEKKLKLFLLPKDDADKKNAIIEIRAGTGGLEASLFAGDLFKMYDTVSNKKNRSLELISI